MENRSSRETSFILTLFISQLKANVFQVLSLSDSKIHIHVPEPIVYSNRERSSKSTRKYNHSPSLAKFTPPKKGGCRGKDTPCIHIENDLNKKKY